MSELISTSACFQVLVQLLFLIKTISEDWFDLETFWLIVILVAPCSIAVVGFINRIVHENYLKWPICNWY